MNSFDLDEEQHLLIQGQTVKQFSRNLVNISRNSGSQTEREKQQALKEAAKKKEPIRESVLP